jgi:O-methyltransferase
MGDFADGTDTAVAVGRRHWLSCDPAPGRGRSRSQTIERNRNVTRTPVRRALRRAYDAVRETPLIGPTFERTVRAIYYSALGMGTAWRWHQDSHERNKFVHILEAVNYVRMTRLPSVFFEFGCYSGVTFSAVLLAARFCRVDLDAYAFDSFEGLPESGDNESTVFPGGAFRSTRQSFKRAVAARSGVRLRDDQIIAGFYDTSLTDTLARRLPTAVGLVNIDVDLYASTVPVLEFLKDKLVDGTVLLFDDWHCFPPGHPGGERRALEEFLDRHPALAVEPWKNYSLFGKSFFVVRRHGSPAAP